VSSNLKDLSGVGDKLCEKLAKLGIFTQLDLLLHLPKNYQDRTKITPFSQLHIGQEAVVEGLIQQTHILPAKREILACELYDGSGHLSVKFFHFYPGMKSRLKEGVTLRCFGRVSGQFNHLDMIHPEWRIMSVVENPALEETLTPHYGVTEGITSQKLAQLIQKTLQNSLTWLDEFLPLELLKKHRFMPINEAFLFIHSPPTTTDVVILNSGNYPAQQRLVYEELLAHCLSNQDKKKQNQQRKSYPLVLKRKLADEFLLQLPFKLTRSQSRVYEEINIDLQKQFPMGRLIQGDVGCGKTVVAALSILSAIENGFQGVILAPTEILAEQHYLNFSKWFEPLGIRSVLLISKLPEKRKREVLHHIQEGVAQVIVGTHAVFQKEVQYKGLAIVVIDEQHRFGVKQRLELIAKGVTKDQNSKEYRFPHQLTMTATPIPRTMAMTMYGDLDISVIDELPANRQPIQTVVLPYAKKSQMTERLQHHFAEKKQAYWVCPLVESSENLSDLQDAEALYESLCLVFKSYKIGLLHGRLKSKEKTEIMSEFKTGKIDLLVATTVIEVGVDVPNASIMIIENPERLGLSQLHQLRGRVGRGDQKSTCVLLYNSDIGQHSKARLKVIRENNDGFVIAEKDLKLRGPGEVLGTKQTGDIGFKIVMLERDHIWFDQVQKDAIFVIQKYPELGKKMIDRWLKQGVVYSAT